jgi:hypothetical protein
VFFCLLLHEQKKSIKKEDMIPDNLFIISDVYQAAYNGQGFALAGVL